MAATIVNQPLSSSRKPRISRISGTSSTTTIECVSCA
jgi:hypothetical protein